MKLVFWCDKAFFIAEINGKPWNYTNMQRIRVYEYESVWKSLTTNVEEKKTRGNIQWMSEGGKGNKTK